MQLRAPFDEHNTCIIPVILPDYSRIMLMLLQTDYFGNYVGILGAFLQARVYKDSWVTDSWLADLSVALLIDILDMLTEG